MPRVADVPAQIAETAGVTVATVVVAVAALLAVTLAALSKVYPSVLKAGAKSAGLFCTKGAIDSLERIFYFCVSQ